MPLSYAPGPQDRYFNEINVGFYEEAWKTSRRRQHLKSVFEGEDGFAMRPVCLLHATYRSMYSNLGLLGNSIEGYHKHLGGLMGSPYIILAVLLNVI